RMTTREMHFPLLSNQQGPTVIDGRGDLTFIKGASSEQRDLPSALGFPGIYYAHNVLPSTYGWQSVSYSDVWAGAGDLGFFDIEICQGAIIDETNRPAGTAIRTYIAARYNETIDGTILYYLDSEGNWVTPLTAEGGIPLSLPTKVPMTTADVNGVTYIYFQGAFGPYVLDTITGTLHMRVLEGLEIADIKGILATNGYLLAWSGISIAWSSTIDVEDFVPSDITDAGGGSIQEIKGNIVHCRLTD